MAAIQKIPIQTTHLFPILDKLLIELLRSLGDTEWHSPTIAKLWTVKDIAAHLLDGNLRTLSSSRDGYFGEKAENINSYADLVLFLNNLNHDWTNAARRISPRVLTDLLEITGKGYSAHLKTLNPFDEAIYSVAWTGQQVSENWFHIAREYTEKFIHQQQVRDAVGKPGILTKELFFPFIDTLMYGLPHTYRNVAADTGTLITINIVSEIGGMWSVIKTTSNWELTGVENLPSTATITMQPDTAWKLFSKGISPGQAYDEVDIAGDKELGRVALQMVSVMA